MKKFISFLFICVSITPFSQSWLPIQHDTLLANKHEFIFSGVADYAATSLEKSLTKKLFYGGEITDAIKDKSRKLHREVNQFGSDINTEFEYRNYSVSLFKKPNWGFIVKGGFYSFVNTLYSKDLFNLTFYGNQDYIGDTAFLSGTKFSSYTFQKVGFGWLDKKSKSSVCLNFINLSGYSDAFIRKGELYQSQLVDTLSISFDGGANYTSGTDFMKGSGIGLDADIRFFVPTKNGNPMYYQFLARNIGFASIQKPMNGYEADTVFTMVGLTFNQVLNGSSFLDSNFALLDTLGIEETQLKKTVFLPGFLQFSKLVDVNSARKLQEFYGLRMFLASAYKPLVFAGLDYRINFSKTKTLNIGLNSSYGGFSRFRFGLYSSVKINNWNVGISSENLIGKTGESILFRLQCAF
jgi:hypothetical protein